MLRALLLAAAALLLLGAKRPETVDYRVSLEAPEDGAPYLAVEMRLRGDADGETRLIWPSGLSEPRVSGASSAAGDEPGFRVLRHAPRRKLRVRYAVRITPRAQGAAALGEAVLAAPDGRLDEQAEFRWARLPRDWRAASDLEHAAEVAISVADARRSVILAGPNLEIAEAATDGRVVRAAVLGDAAQAKAAAEAAGPILTAHRAFWRGGGGPFFVALGATDTAIERGDAVAAPLAAGSELKASLEAAITRTWIPGRTGRTDSSSPAWLTEGLPDLVATRIALRAGLVTPDKAVGRLAAFDRPQDPVARGALLALKWDEDIRRNTGGKADLDDVMLRMRDHYLSFPPGQGPDLVTGLVSAAWVVAQVDLRPDIARYAQRGEEIPLPEQMFDGCLDARVNVSPGFDSGFDHEASARSKVVQGVRRRGPAWNSGLRDGMRIETMDLKAGDMTREIVLTVRPARGRNARARTLRYWPYGDNDVEVREIALAFGLEGEALAACGRKIGGL
jgi:hypothetical protein